MTGNVPSIANDEVTQFANEDKKLILRGKKEIEHPGLIHYLQSRGIPLSIDKDYLKEFRVVNKDSGKTLFALGLRNEDAGYEIRSPFFKGCVGSKSVTFFRGTKAKPDGVNIFEGMMDYLSILAGQKGKSLRTTPLCLTLFHALKRRPDTFKIMDIQSVKLGWTMIVQVIKLTWL